MNFYGPAADAHRALSLGRRDAERVTLHHARSDPLRDQDRFYYEEAERDRTSVSHTGRSRVVRLSSRERRDAEASLREYGQDERNLPRRSEGTNCHNFAAGAVGVLEAGGYAPSGSTDLWQGQHRRRQSAVAADLQRQGRHWESTQRAPTTTPAEHGFGRRTEERRPPGRLNMDAFANLGQPANRGQSRPSGSRSSRRSSSRREE